MKKRIERMIERLQQDDVCMHGFLMFVGGQLKAKAYYAPFSEGQPHRMYSVSKTLTGIAVGMLADDGKLCFEDKIVSYFSDLLPPSPDDRLMRLTISDMLRMATCYQSTAYREGIDENWTKPFFTAQATHEPGMVFHYDTGSSQVLASLVKRLSGLEVIDFLNERLFSKIGATDEKYWLRDPSGACQGGTGLCLSLRDLSKVALCVMRGGDGVIPSWYCQSMSKRHIQSTLQSNEEERYGYCWQCWRTRAGYAMYGLGGQLAICCPDKDTLLCTIADTRLQQNGVQRIYNAFFEEVYPYIGQEDMAQAEWSLVIQPLPNRPEYVIARTSKYHFAQNKLGICSLTLEGNRLIIENARGTNDLRFGLGKNIQDHFPGCPNAPTLCSGGYLDKGLLRVRCHVIGDAPCGVDMLISFSGDCVTVQSRRSSDPVTEGFEGVASGYLSHDNDQP